jgi:hypothetical protein
VLIGPGSIKRSKILEKTGMLIAWLLVFKFLYK